MKFNIYVTDGDKKWKEEYNEDTKFPLQWAKETVKRFNDTLRKFEKSRSLIKVTTAQILKMIYFADPMNDTQEEVDDIKHELEKRGIEWAGKFDVYEDPSALEKKFDVLFFDWGGMSMGNSLLEGFCGNILDHAKEHPSRIYIMNSAFTKQAMEDVMYSYPEVKEITNVFLTIDKALPYLSEQEVSESEG